jgi:hypothetical protein
MKGKQPEDLRSDAKACAERMGYHWAENTDPTLPFDGFMYRETVMVAVKSKKIRCGISDNCIIEQKFTVDVAALRTLPLPPYVLREFWIRTQNERAFRRFYVLPDTTAEIKENTKEGYRNTHYRETYLKNAPYRIDIPLHRADGEDTSSQKTP